MASNVNTTITVKVRDQATRDLKRMESNIIRIVGAISAAFAAGSLVLFPIKAAIDFEREMKNVEKTTGFVEEDIKSLSKSLIDMSRELGTSAIQLASIAAIAGQLGLGDAGVASIEKFTASVARAAVTLGLTNEAVAEFGAQVSAIFNIDPGNVEKVFSAVNEVSNKTVASGKDIIDIVKRIGTVASGSVEEVIALAGSLKQLGVTNEVGSTFFIKLFPRMRTEAENFAKVMGMTTEEWENFLATEGNIESFLAVTKKLSQLPAGEQIAQIMDLGGEGGRLMSVFAKYTNDAVNSQTQLAKILDIGHKAYLSGTSSLIEYEKVMSSVRGQINIFVESFKGLSIGAGNKALAAINSEMKSLSETLRDPLVKDYFASFGEDIASIVKIIGKGIRSLAGFSEAFALLGKSVSYLLALEFAKWVFSIGKAIFGYTLGSVKELWGALVKLTRAVLFLTVVVSGSLTSAITSTIPKIWGLVTAFTALVRINAVAGLGIGTFTSRMMLAVTTLKGFKTLLISIGALILKNPIGLALTGLFITAGLLIDSFDGILTALGFVDEKTREIRKAARIAEDEADQALDAANASVQDMITKLNSLGGKSIEVEMYTINFNEDSLNKALTTNINTAAMLGQEYVNADLAVKTYTDSIAELSKEYEDNKGKIVELEDKIQSLKKETGSVGDFSIYADIESAKAGIETLKDRQEELTHKIEETKDTLSEFVDAYNDLDSASKKSFGGSFLASITAVEREFIQLAISYKEVQAAQKKLREEIKGFKEDQAQEDVGTEDFDNLGITIANAENNLIRLNDEVNSISDSYGKMKKSVSSANSSLATQVDSLDVDKLKGFNRILKEQVVSTKESAKARVEETVRAMGQYEVYKKLSEEHVRSTKTIMAFGKTSKSVLDNVGNEIVALRRKVAKFNIEIENLLRDREFTISYTNLNNEVDREFDNQEKRVAEYYDKRISAAQGAAKTELEIEKAKILGILEIEREATKSKQKEEQLLQSYKLSLGEVERLVKEADKAAKNGEASRALVLRDQAKAEISGLQDIIKELASLTGVEDGVVFSLVDDESIRSMKNDVTDVSIILEDGLKKSAESLDAKLQSQVADLQKLGIVYATAMESAKKTLDYVATSYADVFKLSKQIYGILIETSNVDLSNVYDAYEQIRASGSAVGLDTKELSEQAPIIADSITTDIPQKALDALNDGLILRTETTEAIERDISSAIRSGVDDANIAKYLGDSFAGFESSDAGSEIKSFFINTGAAAGKASADAMLTAYTDRLSSEMSTVTANVVADTQSLLEKGLSGKQTPVKVDWVEIKDENNIRGIVTKAEFDDRQVQEALGEVDGIWIDVKARITDAIVDPSVSSNFAFGGAVSRSSGGAVRGPGTSTSDSIPAWLSAGEWVIDAFTTKYFGGSFFAGLQSIARSRKPSSTKNGLPAFSGGGLVERFRGSNKPRDEVNVNVNIAGNSSSLFGERDQVNMFVSSMKKMNRGRV